MPYHIAVAAAQADADMYCAATVEQDADRRRIIVLVDGKIVAQHRYRD